MRALFFILLLITNVAHAAEPTSPKTTECQGQCPTHQVATSPKGDER